MAGKGERFLCAILLKLFVGRILFASGSQNVIQNRICIKRFHHLNN